MSKAAAVWGLVGPVLSTVLIALALKSHVGWMDASVLACSAYTMATAGRRS